MFGYDWPRLHAALNDLPAALLLVSVLFDLAGAVWKRPSLATVGFWTLLTGTAGTAAAVVAGELAEDVIEHSDEAHVLMERHETLGLAVLGVFAVLAAWRLVRRGAWRERERPWALGAGVVGVGLMVATAGLGGTLVFDHALGIPTARLHAIEAQRGGEEHEHDEDAARGREAAGAAEAPRTAAADTTGTTGSAAASARTGRPHTHADSTAHTRERRED